MAANECGKVVIVRWPCPDQLAPKFGAPSTEHFFAQPHIRNELKIFKYKGRHQWKKNDFFRALPK